MNSAPRDAGPRPRSALRRAAEVGAGAAQRGFDWPTIEGPLAKVSEELAELRAELAPVEGPPSAQRLRDELGDLLFAAVNVARHLDVDPEAALDAATDRFEARYRSVGEALTARGGSFEAAAPALLDRLWEQAKAQTGG